MTPQKLLNRAYASPNLATGLAWYRDASEALDHRARRLDIPHNVACAVAAQLSPAVRWETALDDVERLYHRGEASTYPVFRDRALEVLQSGDPRAAPWGPKTWAFYHNLAFPEQTTLVTLDRWQGRLHGVPRWTPRLYGQVSQVYQDAARLGGLLPHQLQAVLWLDVREEA